MDPLPPPGAALGAFVLFNIVTSVTPGPNNIMLAASGARVGFRATAPMMLGVFAGATLIFLLNLLGFGALITALPGARGGLKLIGCLYLFWLAWKIWSAAPPDPRTLRPLVGFYATVALQFVNPKLWLVAASAALAFVPPGGAFAVKVALFTAVYAATIVPSIFLWTGLGALMQRVLTDDFRRRVFNGVMAAATALTALSLFIT
jgi:threonine/homoserine/homoserine lactone efflux protein